MLKKHSISLFPIQAKSDVGTVKFQPILDLHSMHFEPLLLRLKWVARLTAGREIVCSLMLDEMAIKKHVSCVSVAMWTLVMVLQMMTLLLFLKMLLSLWL